MSSERGPLTLSDVAMSHAYTIRCRHAFKCVRSRRQAVRQQRSQESIAYIEHAPMVLWLGLAIIRSQDRTLEVGMAFHDGTYTTDFAVHVLHADDNILNSVDNDHTLEEAGVLPCKIDDFCIRIIREYSQKNDCKILGAGLHSNVVNMSSRLSTRLWAELDIVSMVLDKEGSFDDVDEVADSMARKCIMYFGPKLQPRLMVGRSNNVEVDVGGKAKLISLDQYAGTVGDSSFRAFDGYARSMRSKNYKLAFFSATPQGGGVALMRHALSRLFGLVDVKCTWWVPTPKPAVFQITKRNHNILQGVAKPDDRLSEEDKMMVESWTSENAARHWTKAGGPLAPRSAGGADVIVVDDPQMPSLVSLAKRLDPERPVIFRSHIQIRSDLVGRHGSNAAAVWEWIWSHVKHADLFVSHPVASFVPTVVPRTRLAYMPATTDWLDGLNKQLSLADLRYYLAEVNELCRREHMPALTYPKRDYIIQVARFDPSKGLEDVLGAYAQFRRYSRYCAHRPSKQTPQLVICGQSSIDDPDGIPIHDKTLACLEERYSDIKDSVIIMRLGPSDQLLDMLLSNAHVALQLSLSEGFEIKVSEALHKGVPVIARGVGGIPLQIEHEKSGFIVHASDRQSDIRAVAEYLDVLFDNQERYDEISRYARKSVSDEVGTVGNAICWMYLTHQLLNKPSFRYNGRWVWELAREEAEEPIRKGEARLQHVRDDVQV